MLSETHLFRFEALDQLLKILDNLKITKSKEEQSAHNCVLIQGGDGQITFTTCEPRQGVYELIYKSSNSNDLAFTDRPLLVDLFTFKSLISQLKPSLKKTGDKAIIVRELEGDITLSSLELQEYLNESEIPEQELENRNPRESLYKHTRMMKPYNGSFSDFKLPQLEYNHLGYLSFDHLTEAIKILNKFTRFENVSSVGPLAFGREVLILFGDQDLTLFCNSNVSTHTFLKITRPATVENELSVSVDGKHLSKFYLLAENDASIEVSISNPDINENRWIRFKGPLGNIQLNASTPSRAITQSYDALYTQPETVNAICARSIHPLEFKAAFLAQKSIAENIVAADLIIGSTSQTLSNFFILNCNTIDPNNIRKNASYAEISLSYSDENPWRWVSVSYGQIATIVDTLQEPLAIKTKDETKRENDLIIYQQQDARHLNTKLLLLRFTLSGIDYVEITAAVDDAAEALSHYQVL